MKFQVRDTKYDDNSCLRNPPHLCSRIIDALHGISEVGFGNNISIGAKKAAAYKS